MGRNKVNLALIRNASVRKTTFRKRKAGLIKKVDELTTLCNVQGCAVIFSRHGGDPQTHVWPSAAAATAVLERFQDLPPEKQTKHMEEPPCIGGGGGGFAGRRRRRNRREAAAEAEMEALLTAVGGDLENEEELFGKMGLEEMMELSGYLDGRITAIGGEIDSLRAAAEVAGGGSSESDADDEDYVEEEE